MLEASAIDADAYLRHLHQDDEARPRYLDKNPLNFRYLDMVAREFPRARILHCRRDPRDTALSCKHAIFRARRHGAWSSSWDDIIESQRRYRELIEARPTGIAWLDVDYAALIASPEAVLRQAIGFLGLEWDERVLATPEDGAIGTASIWQARQPLHTRSIGRVARNTCTTSSLCWTTYGDGREPAGWNS